MIVCSEHYDAMQNDNFFFPDQNVQVSRSNFGTISPCVGKTFCEDDTDYPTDLVNRIIEKHQELQSYQIDDTVSFSPKYRSSLISFSIFPFIQLKINFSLAV